MDQRNEIRRREFIKRSAQYAAAAVFLGAGGSRLLGNDHFIQMTTTIPAVTLNNGIEIPAIGFGTNTLRGPVCVQCVSDALSLGYRMIDTARIYGNEEFVGEGIRQSGIKREALFITSKLWVDDSGYESTKEAFETSLAKLGLEYLDLYLIHRPRGDVQGSWKAMEGLYREGRIKAIGLSNFEPTQIEALIEYATVKPAINQIENHVFFQQQAAHEFLKRSDIQMQGWSPFAAGRSGIFENEVLAVIGNRYGKSIAQVCLRWLYQRGIIAIPRSTQKRHMAENLDIFDFELDNADLQTIATLDLNTTQFPEWE